MKRLIFALAAAALLQAAPLAQDPSTVASGFIEEHHRMQQHPYIGMWVTADGYVRQELLPTGRYDEARGERQSAYQGRYEVTGNSIFYWDDTGFTADGEFVDSDELHHGGMIFYRREQPAATGTHKESEHD